MASVRKPAKSAPVAKPAAKPVSKPAAKSVAAPVAKVEVAPPAKLAAKPKSVAMPAAPASLAAPVAVPFPEFSAEALAAMPVQIIETATAQVGELQEAGRALAQRSSDSLRAAYDRTRIASEEAAGSVELAFSKTAEGMKKLQMKAIELVQANAIANLDFSRELATADSPVKAFSLVSEHCRKQAETAKAQSQLFVEMARSVLDESMAPLGATVSKAFGIQA